MKSKDKNGSAADFDAEAEAWMEGMMGYSNPSNWPRTSYNNPKSTGWDPSDRPGTSDAERYAEERALRRAFTVPAALVAPYGEAANDDREPEMPTLQPGVLGGLDAMRAECLRWGLDPVEQHFEFGEDQFQMMTRATDGLANLVLACHGASYMAGWWHDPKTGDLKPITSETVSNKLMLIVSEIAEAMEGDRKGLMDDKLPDRPMIEVELADALIRICDLAGALGADLAGAVIEKMEYNRNRADHKAENRANGGKAY